MRKWWMKNRWYLCDLAVGVAVLAGVVALVWMLVRGEMAEIGMWVMAQHGSTLILLAPGILVFGALIGRR